MKDLDKLRNDLDMCDEIIVDALRMRYQIIQEITNYKQENGVKRSFSRRKRSERKNLFWKNLAIINIKSLCLRSMRASCIAASGSSHMNCLISIFFLIGFMGVGKSTVSKALQRTFAMDVVEMDEIIAKRNGMSISEIFELHGEEYFRNEETELLRESRAKKNMIVSCGGGVPMRQVNVDEMIKEW